MEAALVESETARRLEEVVAARVAEVVASDAVQQSLKARLAPRAQGRAIVGCAAVPGLPAVLQVSSRLIACHLSCRPAVI